MDPCFVDEVSDRVEAAREAEAIATLGFGIETDDKESDFQSCHEFHVSSDGLAVAKTDGSNLELELDEAENDEFDEPFGVVNLQLMGDDPPTHQFLPQEEEIPPFEMELEDTGQDHCPEIPPTLPDVSPVETQAQENSPQFLPSYSNSSPPPHQQPLGIPEGGSARISRQKRNSLALRKNIPPRFSTVMEHWSANSSELYDTIQEIKEGNPLDDSTSTHTGHQGGMSSSSVGGGVGVSTIRGSPKSKNNKNNKRSSTSSSSQRKRKQKLGLLRTTCLNPFFSLRTQMMLSFGFVGVSVICVVMVVCIIVTILSGQKCNRITSEAFDSMSMDIEGLTVRYIAEFVTYRLIPSDLVQILWETTRDRLAGYPDGLGYEQDAQVPFFDIESGTNRYPVVGPTLPLDWQLHQEPLEYQNVNDENYYEHIQDRQEWYRIHPDLAKRYGMNPLDVSTAAGGYFMQGTCNPNITDPTHPTYYPGCTDANNNLVTGGVVAPTSTNQWLHRKSADLIPVLKALYEYHQDLKSLGLAFANGGAGSTVEFPLSTINAEATYISQGCDWLLKANPYNPSRSIGTPEMIARCHPAGTTVSQREYNPLEQAWCKQQAWEPDKVHIEGPHVDASSLHGTDEQLWMMTIGRALYDRITKEFIGCIRVNLVLDFLEKVLSEACASQNSHITLVRWDDVGTVVASSKLDMATKSKTVSVDQLDVGMTQDNYYRLKNLIDYESPWNSTEVRKNYETFVTSKDGYLIGAYPIPPPPDDYDQNYRPLFLAVKSLSKKEIFDQLYVAQDAVDDQVYELVNLSLYIGLVGIVLVLVIICFVSNTLTSPLNFMNEIATDIVNNYADNREEGIDYVLPKYASWITPKTEISDLVAEFQKLVGRFSGTSNAKSMKGKFTEMRNEFTLATEFEDLYTRRLDQNFPYRLDDEGPSHRKEGTDFTTDPQTYPSSRKHSGRIICSRDTLKSLPYERRAGMRFARERKWFFSPLFSWIVLLIATPLLLTTMALSAIVTYRISTEFPELVEDAKVDYLALELFALQLYVALRADFISAVTTRSIRDLHLLTRYSNWLLFNGVRRADSFTEIVSGVEACKVYDDLSDCPVAKEWPCDCEWDDETEVCYNFTTDSRYFQRISFVSESLDVRADGDRNSTSFPKVAYSQQSTSWWDDASTVPGFEKGSNASGYETTYDRMRVISALPMFQPLWNYDVHKEHVEGAAVAFEDDGTLLSFSGCNGFVHASQWVSSPENRAPSMRPELCPEGKYGYDPRCRPWYYTGRNSFLDSESTFYLTSTYQYGSRNFAQSATAPLVDPASKKHVGQTLIDFHSNTIFETLNPDNTPICDDEGYTLLITPRPGSFRGDTVIGPGFVSNGPAPPVESLVFSDEEDCLDTECPGNEAFRSAVLEMKRGFRGSSRFAKDGRDSPTQTMHIAFAPVRVNALFAKNSSDFARGVDGGDHLIYSLGFVVSIKGILKPFESIEDEIDRQANTAMAILSMAIVFAACLVVYISGNIALSIAKPMVYLVNRIRLINCLSVDDITSAACPEVDKDYGCCEVRHVASTMEVLYKVIRDANVAFFAGDVETAYAVLTDTLRLFIRLDNKKAIGVGNNNLGNTMLTMYRRMQSTGEEHVCGFTKRDVVEKGIAYFHKAIKLGEALYDDFYETEGWSPNCLGFMQHLANRYYNRGLFLLTVKDSHQNPKELEELGFRDLQIVRDMDIEIVDEGTQVGWNVRTADQLFDVKLSRIKGLIQLLEMGYADEWDLQEHLDDACMIVKEELKNESSKLFEELTPAGRMQQVETELMRYLMLKDEIDEAAKVAIRMLVEDEYTLPNAQVKAVEVILALLKSSDNEPLKQDVINYRMWVNAMAEENDFMLSSSDGPDTSDMSEVFQLSTARLSTASTLTEDRRSRKSTLRESSRGDFTMEVF